MPRRAPRSSRSRRPVVVALSVGSSWLLGCASHETAKVEVRGECMSCHGDELEVTKAPPHALVKFTDECGSCHDEDAWSPAPRFVHVERFPLTLGHDDRACSACHEAGYEADAIQRECVECHDERAQKIDNPVHAGLTTDCFACHRTDSFKPARFVHSWPLSGVHKTTECRACHVGNPATYEGTSTQCLSCHRDDRLEADRDSVEHAGYPNACEGCHNAQSWQDVP